jgi:hypothetical protein
MFFGRSAWAMIPVFCLGQVLSGCGALEENTPDRLEFAFRLSDLSITSSDADWRGVPPGGIPDMICAGPFAMGTDCCSPPQAQPIDCQTYPLTCDPSDNYCGEAFAVSNTVDVDMVSAAPAIAAVQGRIFSRVELQSLTTEFTNGGQLPIRAADLYIGALGSTGQDDMTFFAPVRLDSGKNTVVLDPAAAQAFSGFARNYQTRFSLLLSAQVLVKNSIPPGRSVDVKVTGQAVAYY